MTRPIKRTAPKLGSRRPGSTVRRGLRRRTEAKAVSEARAPLARDPDVSDAIANDAAKHFHVQHGYRDFLQSDPERTIAWFRDHVVKRQKLSRQQHLEAFVDAYALYAQVKSTPKIRYAVLEAARKLGRELDGRTSALRLILELVIAYGSEVGEEAERRAGKLYSRDVAAVTNLIKRGIPPTQVIDKSKEPEEGLHRWATWKFEKSTGEGRSKKAQADVSGCDERENRSPARKQSPSTTPDNKSSMASTKSFANSTREKGAFSTSARSQKAVTIASRFDAVPNELRWYKKLPDGNYMLIDAAIVSGGMTEEIEQALTRLSSVIKS